MPRSAALNPGSLVLVLALLLYLPSAGLAVPGDENWDTHWNFPGTNGAVEAILEFDGDLIIAGEFTFVGDVAANNIARFNGSTWEPMDVGFEYGVYALAEYNSELYAGGYGNLGDGTPVGGLARWTGTQWVTVDDGTDGYVEDMAVYDGELVIAGYFTEVGGGTSAGGIAGWNGSTWNDFDEGTYNGLYDIEVFDGDLYVVGEIDEIGYEFVNGIAKWDGSSWSSPGYLTDEFGDPYNAYGEFLGVHDGQLIVTGYFQKVGSLATENFAAYNGSTWSATFGGDPSYFSDTAGAIGSYNGDLYVSGNYATHVWNGFFWSASIYYGGHFCFGTYGSDFIFGGLFSNIVGVQAKNLARYNGSTFSAMAAGDGASTGIMALTEWNGQLAAGGTKSTYGPVTGSIVAAWDGNQWNALGSGIIGGIAYGVYDMTSYAGNLIAVGSFDTAGGVSVDRIAQYDGAAWSAMGAGSPGAGSHAVYVFGDSLYAGVHNGGYHVGRWDSTGSAWIPVGGNANNILWDIGEYNGQLVLGGSFSMLGGNPITGLAAWDGSTWSEIGGSALNGSVYCMAENDGKLYIGGTFTSAGGGAASRIAMYDGVSWSEVGGGVNNRVFDMKFIDDDLFITGEFTNVGVATSADYVARWDGSDWDVMGSGLDEEGEALACYNNTLFVGGDFRMAGAKASEGIAGWSMTATGVESLTPPPSRILTAFPNPFRGSTSVEFTLMQSADVDIRVFDVRGRMVASTRMNGLPAGVRSYTWDGRDTAGNAVASGTYYIAVRTDSGQRYKGRVTVLR